MQPALGGTGCLLRADRAEALRNRDGRVGAGQFQSWCPCQERNREFSGGVGSSGLFSPSAVAEQLIARGQVQVPIGKAKYKLKISPYMRGEVTNIQVRPRTPLQNSTCRLGARGALPPAAPCSPRG